MGLIQILNNTRQMDIISILGMPVPLNGMLLNTAVVIQKGKILGVVPKTYLPNYKEFMRSAGSLLPVRYRRLLPAYADR